MRVDVFLPAFEYYASLTDQPALDRSFIRATLADLVGADDPRLSVLGEIERDVDQSNEE